MQVHEVLVSEEGNYFGREVGAAGEVGVVGSEWVVCVRVIAAVSIDAQQRTRLPDCPRDGVASLGGYAPRLHAVVSEGAELVVPLPVIAHACAGVAEDAGPKRVANFIGRAPVVRRLCGGQPQVVEVEPSPVQ